jgi:hypothetical protein
MPHYNVDIWAQKYRASDMVHLGRVALEFSVTASGADEASEICWAKASRDAKKDGCHLVLLESSVCEPWE